MLSSLVKYSIRNSILVSGLAVTALLTACGSHENSQSDNISKTSTQSNQISANQVQNDHATAEKNKQIVTDFYDGVFIKHQVQAYADRYIGQQYIQHNPHVPDGKAPFTEYFIQYFKENPQAKSVIKRAVADGDLVFLHVHSQQNAQDRGTAVVDIFRVENGKIVEHWDVQQEVPEKTANQNTMF